MKILCDGHEEIWFFEPMPDAANWLAENNQDPRIYVIQAACGTKSQRRTMTVYNGGLSSSFGVCTEQARRCYSNHNLLAEGEIVVDVVNVYEYLTAIGIDELETLATDAQGMDLEILKTVSPWLKDGKIGTVICEADRDGFRHYDEVPPNNVADFHEFMTGFPAYEFAGHTDAMFNPDLMWIRKKQKGNGLD